jgi:prolyl-tRNA editing enzyme YbaK/EbsC (Cys-tRNA(Pro) deacylase)
MSGPSTPGPYADLVTWLEDHGVPFELHDHPLTYTASATAHVEGVSEREFAKVVGIRRSDGSRMLAVVDAADVVDLVRLAAAVEAEWVTLLTEREMEAILPGCEAGTVPPVPELARVPVIADEGLRTDRQITFHAGSHRTSVRVDRAAWEEAAGIVYRAFASPVPHGVGV